MVDAAETQSAVSGTERVRVERSAGEPAGFFSAPDKGASGSRRYILDSGNKAEVVKTLMKHLRLNKPDEGESSYKVLRLMTTLDLAPNPAAFKSSSASSRR